MSPLLKPDDSMYYKVYKADEAWHAEIVRVFGDWTAANARYDERGVSTPELRALRDKRDRAIAAYETAWQLYHHAQRSLT